MVTLYSYHTAAVCHTAIQPIHHTALYTLPQGGAPGNPPVEHSVIAPGRAAGQHARSLLDRHCCHRVPQVPPPGPRLRLPSLDPDPLLRPVAPPAGATLRSDCELVYASVLFDDGERLKVNLWQRDGHDLVRPSAQFSARKELS